METATSYFTIKSTSRFLRALFLLVMTLAVAMGSQPGLAQTVPPCTVSLIDTYTDNDGVPQAIDIDKDDDGLIEICDLGGLNAIRHQMDGTGYKASGSATKITAGCPTTGCKGYELTRDLDFNDDDSYSSTANKITWTTATGWEPIGERSLYVEWPFVATFDGNSYTISNLMINRSSPYAMGLFGYVRDQSKIVNVGLLNVNVNLRNTGVGNNYVGGLVGYNYRASIINSYVTGSVSGTGYQVDVGGLVGFLEIGTITNSFVEGTISGGGSHTDVGGLVGQNLYGGRITNSYATGSVSGTGYRTDVGGLVGWNLSRGTITNSYAAVAISGPGFVGGLIGSGVSRGITNSYWDRQISGRATVRGGEGKTTVQLQSSTSATGIYNVWSGDAWDFGTTKQYPALKYSDGTVMPNQGRAHPDDAPQIPQVEIAGVPTGAVNEGNSVTLTASSQSTASLSYRWTQASGKALLIAPITRSSVTIEVPTDYVSARANTVNVAIMLEAVNDVGSISQQVSIAIVKRNNGKIAALGPPSLSERELAAPSIDLSSDPDGGGSNVSYRWQSRENTAIAWANVPTVANTKETYTIPDGIIGGTQYRLLISYTDGQGYREKVASQAITYERGYSLKEIASLTSCGTTDIDQDDDSLIEICNLEGLHAIRYQMDGSGYRPSSSTMKITAGCPATGCKGYELSKDLDFNDATSYRNASANQRSWTTGEGWEPIRLEASPFNAIFKANHYRISNLMINRPATREVGLFGRIEAPSRIEGVALINVNISGIWGVGGLVGTNSGGVISNSYATGTIRGGGSAGGLVGDNAGSITNSYTNVSVSGDSYVGGLVGCNFDGGTVANSYTVSRIESSDGSAGGLLGYNNAGSRIVVNSYWDGDVNGIFDGAYGMGLTTEQLQFPIMAGSTSSEIYYGWSDEVWDFGTTVQYPALKYSDGTVIPNQPRERSDMLQMPQVEIAGVPSGVVDEGERITLTASSASSASAIPLSYSWSQVSGGDLLIEPTSLSSVTIEVPEDYVSANVNSISVVLILEAVSDAGSTSSHVSITIAKRNNGRITALGAPNLNKRALTAPAIDLSGDPDVGGSDVGYQWQSRESTTTAWANVSDGTNRTHTIAEDIFGTVQYRVVVSYTDGQGYSEEVISSAVVYKSRYSLIEITSLTSCGTTNIDQDGDGLIEICNLEGLNAIRHQLDGSGYRPSASIMKITVGCPATGCKGYELSTDLDFGDNNSYSSTANKITWTTGTGWEPIGHYEGHNDASNNLFAATFNGNNHTISNLMINSSQTTSVGLFSGVGSRSKIINTGLLDANVIGWRYVGSLVGGSLGGITNSYATGSVSKTDSDTNMDNLGGLVGRNYGTIRNSYAAVSVTGNISHNGGLVGRNHGTITSSYATGSITGDVSYIGGLIGFNYRGTITNSYATGSVTGASEYVGGLVSYNFQGTITSSYATGSVTGGETNGYAHVGGLTGYNSWATVTSSYATGSVTGDGYYANVGGLVGKSTWGNIRNSYATGSVKGSGYHASVGGLTGDNERGGIRNSYATGFVKGSGEYTETGGLIGENNRGSITNSYWDKWTSGQTTSFGGTGKTTIELQEPMTATGIYRSWSAGTWDFGTSEQYPALKHSGTVIPNQPRKRPDIPQVEIVGVPTGAVDEGNRVTLAVSPPSDAGNIPLSYGWSQVLGGALLIEHTTESSVTIELPEDYVSASVSSVNLVIMLDVISGVGSTAHRVSITIAKRNNGKVAALTAPVLNRRLTVPSIDWSGDPDGNASDIGYQWQSRESTASAWVNVVTGTGKRYTIAEDVTGVVQYRVVVSYTDGQGYNEEVISQAVVYKSKYSFTKIASLTSCGTTDIDQDNDGLIEICNLEGLNAMRHQMDGTGYKPSKSTKKITAGCPTTGCKGYELSRDLDFDDAASYRDASANKPRWTTNKGWKPIGEERYGKKQNPFITTFDGNGYTISNLMINRRSPTAISWSSDRKEMLIGLFGYTGEQSKIINIGLSNIDIFAASYMGGLVGWNRGAITNSHAMGSIRGGDYIGSLVGYNEKGVIKNSYATGSVTGHSTLGGLVGYNAAGGAITSSYATSSVKGDNDIGGLVGFNVSPITNSYATGSVTGNFAVSGLAGYNYSARITNSYATGKVNGPDNKVGGLVAYNVQWGSVTNSYWNKTTSGRTRSAGGTAKSTTQLQEPTAATGIYGRWSASVWDFGTTEQYPALKYSDGTMMPDQPREQLVPQMPQIEIAGVPSGAVDEGDSVTLTASFPSNAGNIPLNYSWSQVSGEALLIEPTTQSSVTIEVAEDYVPVGASTADLAIMLGVTSDVGSTSQHVSITIAKRNNGKIVSLGAPSLNERELSAPTIDLGDDPDGVGSDIGYQWQSRESSQTTRTVWANVPAATDRTHTIAEDVFGTVQYRVIVSYTDGQGYNEEVISPAVVYKSRYSLIEITSLTSCGTANIDQDNDGLIEICNLEGLNAMRYQLDGSGYRLSSSMTKITAGCPATGCKGYELSTDLDFDNDNSYSSTANKITWTTGKGWQPIGTEASPFNAIFKANKHRISNLMIDRPSAKHVGLFGGIDSSSRIEGVGLINVNVRGSWGIASLAGASRGVISSSYVTGTIRGGDSAGGLVGDNHGRITNSYTNVSVSGGGWIGGMVGCNFSGGTVSNSYTISRIDSIGSKGGILGYNGDDNSSVVNSYWDMDVSGISSGTYGLGQTTIQLQSPTMATGIYGNWSTSEWDFGTTEQYPALKYSDGTVIPDQPRERPDVPQTPQVEIAGVPVDAVDEGDSFTLTASYSSSASAIPLSYSWSQVSGGDLLIEPTSLSSVTIEVPKDYVSTGASTVNLAIGLRAISDVGITTQQVSITIAKRNNGKIAALGAPSLNERELSAPSIDVSGDPDGGGSNIGYQWQSRKNTATAWANAPAGTNRAHDITKYVFGTIQYRVIVSYIDGQGYGEVVISPAVAYEKINRTISVVNPVSCDPTDIDQDNDGLIEICDLEGLNAIRYQLDGIGYKASRSVAKITAGCPATGCKGYELTRDLDFNDDDSYSSTANKIIWTTGAGWQPIGHYFPSFAAIFDGNGYTVSKLMINRPSTYYVGLFSRLGEQSKIINTGLFNIDIVADRSYADVGGLVGRNDGTVMNSYATGSVSATSEVSDVGSLVGHNQGTITNSYATGSVSATGYNSDVGGLVGHNQGTITNGYATGSVTGGYQDSIGGLIGHNHGIITNSYATGSVLGSRSLAEVGGLVGWNSSGTIRNSYATGDVEGWDEVGGLVGVNGGTITNSYATGYISGAWRSYDIGGLVGYNRGTIANSYWDKTTSRIARSAGGLAQTTMQLQEPTMATGIYSGWSIDVWDFGTTEQYPALKYNDGTFMPNQGRVQPDVPQMPRIEIAGVPAGAVDEGESITLTASFPSSASNIPLNYSWWQVSGGDLLIEPTSRSSVTIEVAEDYLSADENSIYVTLILEAFSDVGSTSPHVSITIAKHNNGQITALGAPILNERELSAPAIDLSSDPDGGGSDVGYQWQSRASDQTTRTVWTNVPAGTNRVHTIAEDVLGIVQYRVIVSYTDGQGYNEEVISPAVVYESRYSLIEITSLTSCGTTDIDQDNDGLIEICNLDGLNAIRYQLDGSGYRLSSSMTKITAGCPATGCKGYELSADLDFDNDNSYSSTANKITWTTGKGWQPIGTEASPFNAIFKANKHRISNLMIDRPSARNVALFGGIGSSARIEGIALINVNVRGSWGVASLAGVSRGVISSSYATGTIRGGDSAGGLVGDNHGRITNSYTNVSVSGGDYIGGIVGCNFSGGTVTNSYTVSRLDSSSGSRGGILGNTNGSVANSYWDMNVSGISGGAYGLAQTTTQLQEPTTTTGIYSSWSASVWDFGTTEQYPALKYSNGTVIPNQPRERPEVPQAEIASLTSCGTTDIDQDDDGLIEICNLEGLNAIRYQLDGTGYRAGQSALLITMGCRPDGGCTGYELSRDLDFDDDNSYSSTANKNTWTTGKGWEPIGEMGSRGRFMAKFEGNDYTISNLMINRPETSRVGLFGYVNDQSKISNTGLLNINIVAGCRVGGLVGVNSGSITSSYATGSVTGVRPSNIGYSICSLAHYVGGFVSLNYGSITSSYATVSVEGSNYVGGLASFNSGSITSSYATGSVRGGWAAYVGGLVGENGSGGTITNSYATGSASGTGYSGSIGGLVGVGDDFWGRDSVTNSYWDKTTNGRTRSAGGESKTTIQLQEPTTATGIYSSWSTEVWDFGTTKQYPALKYRDGTIMPNQGRVQPDVPQIPQIEIADVPTGTVNEGDSITLTASSSSTASIIPLDYRWSQVSGGDLLIEPTSLSSVTIEVPEDYLSAGANTVNLAIMLEAISVVGSTSQHVSIAIAKRNNGQIASLGAPSLNERELAAPAIDLSGDPDGGVSDVSYQWQSKESAAITWTNVPAGTGEVYVAPEYTRGVVHYRVVVSYTDGQGYGEEVASDFLAYQGKTNISPSIELPQNNSSIRLMSGQTTLVSVVISEADEDDVVTLMITQVPTMTEVVLVEPQQIFLYAAPGGMRITEFEITALQAGSLSLLLTASDDSVPLRASVEAVELRIEVEAPPVVSCGTTDVDQDDDGLIEICDLEGLNAMRYQWDGSGYREDETATKSTVGCGAGGCKGYELVKDLDFNNSDDYRDLDNKTAWTTGAGWEPMRLESVFEGNDHTIANLMIDREQAGHVGLFGVASGRDASINGVRLIDVDIKARISAGGLVGAMRNGVSISNSYATGDVVAEAKAGGLVGDCSYSAISDSHASGTVSIGYNSAGGLAGYLLACDISDSHALSVVKGFDRVGGLVGDNNGYSSGISNSYAIADVAGRGYYAGGLIGINSGSGSVTGSYAMGEVLGADTVGGLVGYNAVGYTIRDSYSFAAAKGRNHVGGLVGHQIGEIINSYSVGSVIATGFGARSGGLVGLSQNSITDSYWDKTTSGKAQSAGGGKGKTTAQLQSVTTTTELYSSWDGEVWDFGTPQQYPALKRSDGTLMSGQRVGLLSLSVFASDEIPYMFNGEVFDYRLLIADEVDTIKLLPTATPTGVAAISVIGDDGFSESVSSGSLSSEIPLATTQTTLITVKVDFASQASRTYRLTISRAEQSALAQLVGVDEPFAYVFSRSALNDMQSYEVLTMPEWLEYEESESGLMFSGTPGSAYMGGSSEQMLELQINNGDGTTETIYIALQIDSPTTGTVELVELPGGVLQLKDELSDDNGIVEKTHLWEHCPVGADEFSELEGVDGMSYTLPGGVNSAPGTAYRVRTTVVDSLGQRSELTTQIELQRVIKLRIKVFLEGFLQ